MIFRISAAFLVGAFILLAASLSLSGYYLQEQQRLAAAGDVSGAMQEVETAARLDPFDTQPLQSKSLLLQRQGDNEEAADALEEAIRRDPNNYLPYMLLGLLEMNRLNDYDAAVQSYQEALELNPNASFVRTGLAQALVRKGDLEKAREQYEELREADQISLQGLYDLGRIYVRTGDPEKGRETLQAAKRQAEAGLENLGPSSRSQREELIQSVDLAIADALVVQGRYDEAREIVANSPSEQAPAILTLLNTDPEMYRESIEGSEIY
ncbi:hypothetical protein BH24ACT20_BH24ACT20_06200 [soil metagenome]